MFMNSRVAMFSLGYAMAVSSWISAADVRAAQLGTLVPAYFYPSPESYWRELNSAAAQIPLIAILNPNSGPGPSRDLNYVKAVEALRLCGGSVVGYVSSSYTARDMSLVKEDIDRYRAFYAIDGIFVDEMTGDDTAAHVQYYRQIYDYIKALNANYRVITNPGTQVEEVYARRPVADILVTFENETDYDPYVPSSWTKAYAPERFSHLPYAVATREQMTNYVQLADQRRVAWVYVTDDNGSNPWDRLPSYWSQFVQLIKARNDLTAKPSQLTWTRSGKSILTISNQGPPGLYVTQASSNLENWTNVSTNKSGTGQFLVTNLIPTSSTQSYYRVFR